MSYRFLLATHGVIDRHFATLAAAQAYSKQIGARGFYNLDF